MQVHLQPTHMVRRPIPTLSIHILIPMYTCPSAAYLHKYAHPSPLYLFVDSPPSADRQVHPHTTDLYSCHRQIYSHMQVRPGSAHPCTQVHMHVHADASLGPSTQAHPCRSICMPTQVGPSVICTHTHAHKPIHARRSILPHMYPTSPSLFLHMPAHVHTTARMQVHLHQVSPSVQLPYPHMSIGSTVYMFDLITYICTLTSYFQYMKRLVVNRSQLVFWLSLKVL